MPAFRDHFIPCCGYEVHVRTWGDPKKPALVMSHGLARLADDFDHVAPHFTDKYFVLCPSMIGRGLSGWAKNPDQEYTLPFYVAQTFEMLEHFRISSCKWIRTSMGGLIGLAMTAEATWSFISARSVRRLPNGNFMMHYDPEVMRVFAEHIDSFDAWDQFNAISCPVMLISGAKSDLIPPAIVEKMREQKPEMPILTVANCGHAPHLIDEEQIKAIKAFLAD